jgi:two-component system KDP operon response regulator KdpE
MSAAMQDAVLMVVAGEFEPVIDLRQRFDVRIARSLAGAVDVLRSCSPQIVLIADDVPGAPAPTLLRELLSVWHGPYVLVAATRADVAEEILALEAGFDDIWTPAIDPRLALARARVLLRRSTRAADAVLGSMHAFGIALDRARRVASFQQREIALSPREAEVLTALLRHPGRVVERSVFGAVGAPLSPAAVDVTVARLRQRLTALEARHVRIEPVRGRGYCLRLRAASPPMARQALRRPG